MPMFLHAMCGSADKSRTTREFAGPEWEEVRMDPRREARPDVLASLLDMQSLESASFDAAFLTHSLERLYPHEAGLALKNIARVLKGDGYLVTACSDLQAACALVAEDKLLETAYDSPAGPVAALDMLYGFRPALAAGYTDHACKCGFTTRALMGTMAQAGFATMWAARNPETFTIVAIASKRESSEQHLKELANRHFA